MPRQTPSGYQFCCAAALLWLVQTAIETLKERNQLDQSSVLQTIADSAAFMTPDMMLSFLQQAREKTETGEAPVAAAVVDRMGDGTIASFVAGLKGVDDS